ncbi:phage minor capsid protein [Latilactobacillus sakei]
MVTVQEMVQKAGDIANYYTDLQQKIFYLLIDIMNHTRNGLTNSSAILEWRLECLSKMGGLTKETIKLISKTSGKSESAINSLIKRDGLRVASDINGQLSEMLGQNKPISSEVNAIIDSYAHQTFLSIDNNVNQTLLSTNYQQNGADRAFQDILNQTVLEVQTGLKTPQRALADNIYKWRNKGIETNLIDKGGHRWSLEGYTRTVLTSTAHRTFNDVRLQSMKDFNSPLAVMSSHPAAREACAYIQGDVVNVVSPIDERFNPKYDSIYNHGYGTPGGTQGVNCSHMLYPYIEGVSHNYQKKYDPEKVQKNAKKQAQQRYHERIIRALKYDLDLASKLNDESGANLIKKRIRNHQASLRDIVKDNDFLSRQYDREKIYK